MSDVRKHGEGGGIWVRDQRVAALSYNTLLFKLLLGFLKVERKGGRGRKREGEGGRGREREGKGGKEREGGREREGKGGRGREREREREKGK